jgi:para-nitrobenzyl esterase
LLDVYARAVGGSPGERFCAIETDRIFRIPAIRLAEAQAAHQRHTHAYLFTWSSPALGGRLGSCHALDVPFVFGSLGLQGMGAFVGTGPAATRLSERMMDAWLGFARDGSPDCDALPGWEPYEPSRRATQILDAECELRADPDAERRRAWDGIL